MVRFVVEICCKNANIVSRNPSFHKFMWSNLWSAYIPTLDLHGVEPVSQIMHICENLRFVWQSYFAAKFSFLMRSKISIIFFTHMPKQWKSCVYFTLHLLHNLKLVQPTHHFSLYILLPHVRIFSDCCMVLPLCPCVCLFSFYKHKKM